MSEKKEIRIVCDRCGQEIQSANAAAFKRFYIENQEGLTGPLTGYEYAIRNRNTTCAVFHGSIEYIMRGASMRTDDETLDLCAACAESLSEWWGTGIIEGGPGDPFAKCGVVKAK